MKRLALRLLLNVVMGVMVCGGFLENAQAKILDSEESESVFISGGGGIFYPFQGQSGYSAIIQFMGVQSPQERLGVELEFRNYEADVFDAQNVETQSYILRGIGQYFFRSQGISPYIGLGLNFAINVIDEDEVEKQRAIDVKREVGLGYGILGLLGVEIPLGGTVALFGEGRVSGDFQLNHFENRSGDDKITFESLSGVAGIGGLRFRF